MEKNYKPNPQNTQLEKYIKNCTKKYIETETEKEDENEEKIIVTDTIRDKLLQYFYNNKYNKKHTNNYNKHIEVNELRELINRIAYIFILNDITNLNYVRFVFENVNSKNKYFNLQVYFTNSKVVETYEVEHNLFVYAFSRKFIGNFNKEITKEILINLAYLTLECDEEYVFI